MKMVSSTTLPLDIIFQKILVRLPVKSILRFLSVSKSWFSSSTHPTFIQLHSNHVKSHLLFVILRYQFGTPSCTLLRENPFELVDLEIPPPCDGFPRKLVGSVNGLVCFTMEGGFYVWNPFIRSGRIIPPTPAVGLHQSYKSPRSFCMGFGFNPRTNDYNLIVIPLHAFSKSNLLVHMNRHKEEKIIYMYSLNKNSWTEVQSTVEDFVFENDLGISLGGSIYWLAETKGMNPEKKIVSFNIENESFRDIMLPNYRLEVPDDDFGSPTTFSIQVIEESIHLSIIPHGRSHCHIWSLERCVTNVESWIKKVKVVLPEAFWFYSKKDSWVTGLTHDGRLWVSSYDKKERSRKEKPSDNYLIYDPESNRFENCKRSRLWFDCICLTESLVGLSHQEKRWEVEYEDKFSFGESESNRNNIIHLS